MNWYSYPFVTFKILIIDSMSVFRTSVSKELKKEVKKNSEMFYNAMNLQTSDAALFINGMHYDMDYTDIFTLLDAIRQEERVLGGLGRSVSLLILGLIQCFGSA